VQFLTLFASYPSRDRLPVRARTQIGEGANVASAFPSRDRKGANAARLFRAATVRERTRLGVGSPPNFILNVSDLQRIQFGLVGRTYTQEPNQTDPADCP